MLDFSQLCCFLAVAEELHFGRAAIRLNMTQPLLSRQIQILERVLGVVLLDRTSRTVRLTAAGRGFLPEAQRILSLAERAAASTRRIASGQSGTVRMGFTAASAYSFLLRLVLHCRSRMPALWAYATQDTSPPADAVDDEILLTVLAVAQVERPVPQGHEIVLRIASYGICASDCKCGSGAKTFWGGDNPYVKPHVIPGHAISA